MRTKWIFVPLVLVFLTGCEYLPKNWQKEWNNLWAILTEDDPSTEVSRRPSANPSGGLTDEELKSAMIKNAKANSEILREMLQVVFIHEPKDRSEFGNWVDTLNQGASLEGVYNGLTHSSDYHQLEVANEAASAEALRVFGEELANLEAELAVPIQFDLHLNPLPAPAASPNPNPSSNVRVLAENYSKQFVGASIFTLKKVLCDEALRVIASKSDYREKMAIWYSRWAVRMTQRNVDFGISLRNKPDEAFHYKWAVEATEDRVKWEVLNRLHRVLNEANRQKI